MVLSRFFPSSGVFHRDPYARPPAPAVFVLSVLYIVGVIGILLPLHPDFILLTPANLLVSTLILLWYHAPRWENRTIAFLVICYFTGFLAELAGVQTGLIFGNYIYGEVLGPKILGTPLMIGVNWILLTYTAGITTNRFFPTLPPIGRAVIAASAMVALDVLIEPMAVKYGMWSWVGGHIPLKNYFGWMGVALPLQYLFASRLGDTVNKVAMPLFICQVLFFGALNMGEIFF
jgi:putative membrane protein